MKDQKKIEEMAREKAKAYADIGIQNFPNLNPDGFKNDSSHFKQGLILGYTQAQKDLLESASEGFEDLWKAKMPGWSDVESTFSMKVLAKTFYDESRLGMMKSREDAFINFLCARKSSEYRDWLTHIYNIKPYNDPMPLKEHTHLPDYLLAIEGARKKDSNEIKQLKEDLEKVTRYAHTFSSKEAVSIATEMRQRHGLDKEKV